MKEWKDSQKAVNKLKPEFDEFCEQLDIRNEQYTQEIPEPLKTTDPVLVYMKEMLSKLQSYQWNM